MLWSNCTNVHMTGHNGSVKSQKSGYGSRMKNFPLIKLGLKSAYIGFIYILLFLVVNSANWK
jgi:hypothetical protein